MSTLIVLIVPALFTVAVVGLAAGLLKCAFAIFPSQAAFNEQSNFTQSTDEISLVESVHLAETLSEGSSLAI